MSQPKHHSLVEAIANSGIGIIIAFIINLVLFPAMGMHTSAGKIASITIILTMVSVIRNYVLRRLFNRMQHRLPNRFD